MLVHKAHKIQLLPNNIQRMTFRQWVGTARWAYNWGLERKIKAYQETGKSPGAYTLSKKITVMKHSTYLWLCDAPKSIPRTALRQLDAAYANFFRRVKQYAKRKGFPKFKSKKRSRKVFHLEPDTVRIEGKRIRLPKMGWVRMTKPFRFGGGRLIGTVAISERAGKWYVSLAVEIEVPEPIENQNRIGVDLGVKTLAVLSDGKEFENPKAIRHHKQLLARAQRQLARKQKGSNRRKQAKFRVQRIQKRIADIRADATHKATRYIADNYGFVAMEDLNVSGMLKNHSLAGAVSDANFGEFRRQTNYKIGWAGGTVTTIDRWFSSSRLCPDCGCVNSELKLSDRTWICDCGAVHDRDQNAANNILAEALKTTGRLAGAGRGGLGAARPTDEASMGQRSPTCELTQAQSNTI